MSWKRGDGLGAEGGVAPCYYYVDVAVGVKGEGAGCCLMMTDEVSDTKREGGRGIVNVGGSLKLNVSDHY